MDYVCCICGKKFHGWGNNPWPVKDSGECCDSCNASVVVPERIKNMRISKLEKRNIEDHTEELKEDMSGIPEDNDGGKSRKVIRRTNKRGE